MGKSILNALTKGPWFYVMILFFAALIMTVYETVKELIFKGMLTSWQSHSITGALPGCAEIVHGRGGRKIQPAGDA